MKKYLITIIKDGEEEIIERIETEEEMHKRVKCYRRNNIKVKKVVVENIVVTYTEVEI